MRRRSAIEPYSYAAFLVSSVDKGPPQVRIASISLQREGQSSRRSASSRESSVKFTN